MTPNFQFLTHRFLFTGFIVLFFILFFLDIILGSVMIPFTEGIKIMLGMESKETWTYIIFNFRIPKALTAILVGSGLSVTGLIMQTLFRNPLVGPYVLGINSGANLGVALLILASYWIGNLFNIHFMPNSWNIVVAGMIGASLVFIIVFMVSMYLKDNISLLIVGIMFGSITGSVVNIFQQFSSPSQTQSFVIWSFGSLGGVSWEELSLMGPIVLLGTGITLFLIKPLDVLLLGNNYAKLLGVNIKTLKIWIIIATALVSGTITAFTGPIAFIGIAVPHIARLLLRTSSHKILLPACMLLGVIIMLVCDIISQLPSSNTILPLNSITAIIGGTVVIWMILRNRTRKNVANF